MTKTTSWGFLFVVTSIAVFGCNQNSGEGYVGTSDAGQADVAAEEEAGTSVDSGSDILSASMDALTDPGRPGTVYGPKFGGSIMMIHGSANYLGTATATARDGVAHFFGITPPNQRRPKEIYLSFAFPASEWKVGRIDLRTPGIVGMYSFADTVSGEKYALDLMRPSPGADFQMEITSLVPVSHSVDFPDGTTYLLRGKLKARVPSVSVPDAVAIVDFTIN